MTPSALIRRLRARGFRLAAAGGSLRVAPASTLTPGDREAIRGSAAALVAALTPWGHGNADAPLRLMEAADGEVEWLGVDGTRPEVAAAADAVSLARSGGDSEALRFAVADFLVVVRSLAAVRGRAPTA